MEKNTPNKISAHDLLIKTFTEKATLKNQIYQNTLKTFKQLRVVLKQMAADLKKEISQHSKDIVVEYKEQGEFMVELKFAGDVLIFVMHTNIFHFEKDHYIWKQSYIDKDNTRSYCGMINVYNFLADSFKYNRINDAGYMVARLFVNKENHYFVEGKRQLGYLYNDFPNALIDRTAVRAIVESAILYSLSFDLLTPPYDTVKELSVQDMNDASLYLNVKTGKRVGFRFQASDEDIR